MAGLAGERIRTEDTALALSPYMALVSRTTNQSLTSGSLTLVTYTTEDLDTDGLYAPASPTRFTVQHAGIYVAHFSWLLASGGALCLRQLAMFRVNAGEVARQEVYDDDVFIGGGQSIDSGLLNLSAGDYVDTAVMQQDTGSSARNLTSARFSILYVGDGS